MPKHDKDREHVNPFLGVLGVLLLIVAAVALFTNRNEALGGGFLIAGVALCFFAVLTPRLEGNQEVGLTGAKFNVAAAVHDAIKLAEIEVKNTTLAGAEGIGGNIRQVQQNEAPILLTTEAWDAIEGFKGRQRRQLVRTLEILSDHGSLPGEQVRTVDGREVRAAKVMPGVYIFYRSLSLRELERQGKENAKSGVVLLAIVDSDEDMAWSVAGRRSINEGW